MATVQGGVEVKNFDAPEEVRPFKGHGHADVIKLAGEAVGRGVFEPGWRWSNDVKPLAGTDLCQVSHRGYVISGSMTIQMKDGHEVQLKPGDCFAIAPGHEAWVVGDEPCVMVDFGEFGEYAKR